MTVLQPIETDVRGCQIEEMLQKHWGSTHTVNVFREPNRSLGINIVGGKVDLQVSKQSSDALLGIFVKSVVPNSPAGKTGKFKIGDRILEVSGVDLREASHEKAVQAIRNATNPVTFIIQSLIPWKIADNDSNENDCPSPFPSPVSNRSSKSNRKEGTKTKEDTKIREVEENKRIVNTNETASPVVPDEIRESKTAIKIEHSVTEDALTGANLTVVTTQVTPIYAPLHLNSTDNKYSTEIQSEQGKIDNKILENKKEYEKPVSPQAARVESESEEEDDDEDDLREMEGRTVSSKGYAIDRASAANVKRSKDEISADTEPEDDYGYTMNTKLRKRNSTMFA